MGGMTAMLSDYSNEVKVDVEQLTVTLTVKCEDELRCNCMALVLQEFMKGYFSSLDRGGV